MPIQIGWDGDDQRVILATVEGRFTWDELDAALRQTIGMMDSVAHRVHFIIDIRRGQLDIGSALRQVQNVATPESHRNEGLKVVVGAGRMVKMVYGAYRKVIQAMGKDQVFEFTDTLDAARALIERNT